MNKLKIILIEDETDQINIFKNSLCVYKDKYKRDIEVVYAQSLQEAYQKIDTSFDGAIIDLKLGDEEEGGNQVADKILTNFLRIPIIFVTGYPNLVNKENSLILRVRARDERMYEEDLDEFWDIYNTGLTKILGGRGEIEKILNRVFQKNLLPYLDSWKEHGKSDSSRTEKALLRFTLNHLLQILDGDDDQCFPEEVYILPPLPDNLKTGSIMKKKESEDIYVVLSPACDLVVRDNGTFKTDYILLVQVDEESSIINKELNNITSENKKKKKLTKVFGNNYTDYFHWLPRTGYFNGGFINFRKISTCPKDEFETAYNRPHIQISPHFVKDILSRFSSYYARQGQPDIDRNKIIEDIIGSS